MLLYDQEPLFGKPGDSKADERSECCCKPSSRKYDKKNPNIFRLEKQPLYDPVLST